MSLVLFLQLIIIHTSAILLSSSNEMTYEMTEAINIVIIYMWWFRKDTYRMKCVIL